MDQDGGQFFLSYLANTFILFFSFFFSKLPLSPLLQHLQRIYSKPGNIKKIENE